MKLSQFYFLSALLTLIVSNTSDSKFRVTLWAGISVVFWIMSIIAAWKNK